MVYDVDQGSDFNYEERGGEYDGHRYFGCLYPLERKLSNLVEQMKTPYDFIFQKKKTNFSLFIV